MAEDNKDKKETGGDPNEELTKLREENQRLKTENESFMKKKKDEDDQSLTDKVKKEQDERDKKNSDSKSMESALMFNMGAAEFLKTNESILPKGVTDIFKMAEKENYGNAVEKANATKAALIQAFFSQQSNLELLTSSQQSILADYLKLTKNGKEEKAREIYDSLFEPTLMTLKRVKKAEDLGKAKAGFGDNTDTDKAYKDKLMGMANKKYFGGKN